MSQSHSESSSPAARNDFSLLIQERLSARQDKRAAKAAEKSDTLKEEGNALFRDGNFQDALSRYQQAVDVHGPSVKPVLLTNLAATYLNLGMYSEAHDAADRALGADPTSAKARYRRGMARKHMEMWTAAAIDFRTLLASDPENQAFRVELAIVKEKWCASSYWEEEDMNSYSDYETPALEDDPRLGESLSESSDCDQAGNGIPCKFYNRSECKTVLACARRKERTRCTVRDETSVDTSTRRNQTRTSGTGQSSKKKQAKGKKKYDSRSGFGGSQSGIATAGNQSFHVPSVSIGQSSQRVSTKGKKKPTVYSPSRWEELDSDADYENGMFGFTGSEVEELLCQGVKPWDDDAWGVLDALHGY